MKLGDKVVCTEYIKPSKNHFETGAESCSYWEYGAQECVEVEDGHSCDRYKTIEKTFFGVCVGTTTLCTRLNAEYFYGSYGNSGFRFYSDEPQKFAVVYYANNKKRLVPIDKVKLQEKESK